MTVSGNGSNSGGGSGAEGASSNVIAPIARVEVKAPGSILPLATLNVNVRFAQSAYQQSDTSFFTLRSPSELPLDPSQILVLQYGSRNFKVGLAKDALPRTHPQVIAYRDSFFTADTNVSPDLELITAEGLDERLSIRAKQAKKKIPPNFYPSLVAYNRSSSPQTISSLNDAYGFDWTKSNDAPFIVGQAVLRLDPKEGYRKRWPIRNGHFNRQAYRSYHQVINDLDRIWSQVIITKLGIPRRDFPKFGIVLVVPDRVERWELKALTKLILGEMSFKAVAFIPESLSGTFGAGVSAACVLDIGAQTTKVCLVEDGQILRDTATTLSYGGDTLTILFHQILQLHSFPYQECDLNYDLDWEMIDELKVNLGTLDEEDLMAAVYEAYVRKPGQSTKLYPFKVCEERIIVPLSLFEPGVPLLTANSKQHIDEEDGFFYTGADDSMELNYGPSNEAPSTTTLTGPGASSVIPNQTVNTGMSGVGEDSEGLEGEANSVIDDALSDNHLMTIDESVANDDNQTDINSTNLSIIEAIVKASSQIENPERLKKFLSSILIIGNGHKFKRFIPYLEEQLMAHYPGIEIDFVLGGGASSSAGNKENLTMDPGIVSWKGGAVFAKLECLNDFFISSLDLERCGIARVFRDRLSFAVLH